MLGKAAVTALGVLAMAAWAGATTTYGGEVTPTWNVGTGQPTGNFIVNDDGTVQTALRATGRYTGPLAPVTTDGRYYAFPGVSTINTYGYTNLATWAFCYHVNVDTSAPAVSVAFPPPDGPHVIGPDTGLDPTPDFSFTLADVDVFLTVDDDPSAAVSGPRYNLKDEVDALIPMEWGKLYGFRDSTNMGFWSPTFDPNVLGDYSFKLEVYAIGTSNLLSATEMTVSVVPEPLTMIGVFAGLAGVGAYIRKRRMA